VGWEVQYFGTVEPQRRGAPHFHAAIRGTIPRAELRAIAAATYHQVWWPAHDQIRYSGDRLPRWDDRAKGFVDPDTREPLPTFDEACEDLARPAHVVRFGAQVHVKGILGGTEEAGRHIGYLTKYLTNRSGRPPGLARRPPNGSANTPAASSPNSASPRAHPAARCGCSTASNPRAPGCPPRRGSARARRTSPNTSVSPAAASWSRASGRTRPSTTTAPNAPPSFGNSSTAPESAPAAPSATDLTSGSARAPGDEDVPTRPALLHAISERQRWKADYEAAQLAADPPPGNRSATDDQAA
jgi:replication initiator protein RepSA